MSLNRNEQKAFDLLYDLVSTQDPVFKKYKTWYATIVSTTDAWRQAEGNQGVKRMKSILGYLSSLALGESPETISFVKSNSDGVPSLLLPVLPYVSLIKGTDDLSLRRQVIVQSICRLTDIFLGDPKDSDFLSSLKTISTATKPVVSDFIEGKGRFTGKGFRQFLTEFRKQYPNSKFVKQMESCFSLSPLMEGSWFRESSGPNGGKITENSHVDLNHLYHPLNENLRNQIYHLEKLVCENCKFDDFAPDSKLLGDSNPNAENSRVSKITALPSKAGKVRFIAQVDYFTQEAMNPIHNWLMSAVDSFPTDSTKDQKKMLTKFQEWTSQGNYVASFDQSSCTDLFPVDVQVQVIREFKGDDLAQTVKSVLVDRDFEVKFPSGRISTVRWNSGQPMGALGSWPLMAVTHHLLVHYSYWVSHNRRFDKTMFSKYAILGDDIVIADKHVADCYLKVCKDLGMKINLSKSHISSGDNTLTEFAKVLVWRGHVLNVIKPNQLKSAIMDWRNAIPLLVEIKSNPYFTIKVNTMERLIAQYFPKGKKVLNYLIDIPIVLGGFGFPRGSLKDLTRIHDKGFTPLAWYLAVRLRNQIAKDAKNRNIIESCQVNNHNMAAVREYYLNSDNTRHLSVSQPANKKDRASALCEAFGVSNDQIDYEQSNQISTLPSYLDCLLEILEGNFPLEAFLDVVQNDNTQFTWDRKPDMTVANSWERAIKLSEKYCVQEHSFPLVYTTIRRYELQYSSGGKAYDGILFPHQLEHLEHAVNNMLVQEHMSSTK